MALCRILHTHTSLTVLHRTLVRCCQQYHGYAREAHFMTLAQGLSQRQHAFGNMHINVNHTAQASWHTIQSYITQYTKYLGLTTSSRLGMLNLTLFGTVLLDYTISMWWCTTLVYHWWMECRTALFQQMLQHACSPVNNQWCRIVGFGNTL